MNMRTIYKNIPGFIKTHMKMSYKKFLRDVGKEAWISSKHPNFDFSGLSIITMSRKKMNPNFKSNSCFNSFI